jgi:O-antigen/teichoic acid export membrane protein
VTRVTFVLAVSIVLYGVYFIFWVGANVAKKNRMVPVFFVIASAVNVALNFAFVPEYGMWAAAWSAVAGYAILAGTIYFYSRRYYPIPYEWRRLLTVAGATTLSLAAVAAIGLATGLTTSMPVEDLALRTALASTAFAIFPATLALGGFYTPGERRRLGDAWRGLRGSGREAAPPEAEAEEVFELEEAFDTVEDGGTPT